MSLSEKKKNFFGFSQNNAMHRVGEEVGKNLNIPQKVAIA